MPLYKKALNFKKQDLENMTFDECYELLLCFRYLQFRNDGTIDTEVINSNMAEIRKRMAALSGNSANHQNFI